MLPRSEANWPRGLLMLLRSGVNWPRGQLKDCSPYIFTANLAR